jgi:hypothetical protein
MCTSEFLMGLKNQIAMIALIASIVFALISIGVAGPRAPQLGPTSDSASNYHAKGLGTSIDNNHANGRGQSLGHLEFTRSAAAPMAQALLAAAPSYIYGTRLNFFQIKSSLFPQQFFREIAAESFDVKTPSGIDKLDFVPDISKGFDLQPVVQTALGSRERCKRIVRFADLRDAVPDRIRQRLREDRLLVRLAIAHINVIAPRLLDVAQQANCFANEHISELDRLGVVRCRLVSHFGFV